MPKIPAPTMAMFMRSSAPLLADVPPRAPRPLPRIG
jgi:hypothetical protein